MTNEARPSVDRPADPPWLTLDLVLAAAWQQWWLVLGSILLFAAMAAFAAYRMTPMYKAEVVVIPVKSDDARSALTSMVGQLGGLASVAGLSLSGGGNKEEYIQYLRSNALTARFIEKENLLPVLFARRWDSAKGAWDVDDPEDVPTLADGMRFFNDRVRSVNEERRTGIVTLGVVWSDRELAAQWANQLVDLANSDLRQRAVDEAKASAEYLNAEIAKTTLVEVRDAIYRVLESQIKNVMLANVRGQYAFRVIDPAIPPDADDTVRPKRLAMILLGAVFGGAVGLAIVLWQLRRLRLRREPVVAAA
jgi:uncharacterized protein involved in exopolysaccharide biosynthesis